MITLEADTWRSCSRWIVNSLQKSYPGATLGVHRKYLERFWVHGATTAPRGTVYYEGILYVATHADNTTRRITFVSIFVGQLPKSLTM